MKNAVVRFQRADARGLVLSEWEGHLDFFLGGFESWLAEQPVRVYLDRPNWVAGVGLPFSPGGPGPGFRAVVKRFGWRSPFHRVWSRFTEPKALRSFRIGMDLLKAGAATPRPVIAWERRSGPGPAVGYYITEELPDATSLRTVLKTGPAADRPDFLARAAALVRAMHDAGILHRDLTLGNFLATSGSGRAAPGIYIVDLSRAVRWPRLPLPLRIFDLARMNLAEHWPDFFADYVRGRPNWSRWELLLRAAVRLRRGKMAFWKRVFR